MVRHGSSRRYRALYVSLLILGLLLYTQSAPSTAAAPNGPARFEQASVAVSQGSNCILHPEGNQDPGQSLHVNADEDGVARFLAVRPTRPNSVTRLQLDCNGPNGQTKTYTVDLRSAATFAPHPFDGTHTTLAVRPALTGDPSSLTQEALVKAGYGPRPDPTRSPEAYRVWLAAARMPMRRLRVDRTLPTVLHRTAFNLPHPHVLKKVVRSLSSYWTGAIMSGSYHKSTNASQTQTYLWAIATFNVPTLFQGVTAAATMWAGLDNVCQAIVDVNTTPSAAGYGIHRQCFDPHAGHTDTAGVRFTPQVGDLISIDVSYCDANGNLNASGGYMCTFMADTTQNVVWDCTLANGSAENSNCPSYKLNSGDVGNGKLGFQAEFIIENDSGQVVTGSQQWPAFGLVTMADDAIVAKAHFVDNSTVNTSADPNVSLLLDKSNSTRHERITLPYSAVEWSARVCQSNQKWDANKASCVAR